jgi:hypothetical protein
MRERLTGAPVCQLCQMQALSASSRCTMRADSPAGTRPPWRSRPSWFFKVQMIASTRDRLNLLAQPVREAPGGLFVCAGRADQHQAQVPAGEEPLGLLPGQALIDDHGGCPAPGGSPSGVRASAGPARVPRTGWGWPDSTRSRSRRRCRSTSAWRPSISGNGWGSSRTRAHPYRSERRAVRTQCPHGTGWRPSAGTAPRWPACDRTAQRRLHQRRGGLEPVVVLALAQQPGKQVPDALRRGPQPVPLVVIAQLALANRAVPAEPGWPAPDSPVSGRRARRARRSGCIR